MLLEKAILNLRKPIKLKLTVLGERPDFELSVMLKRDAEEVIRDTLTQNYPNPIFVTTSSSILSFGPWLDLLLYTVDCLPACGPAEIFAGYLPECQPNTHLRIDICADLFPA